MALEFMDGFDHYNGAVLGARRKWDASSGGSGVAGRFGGGAWDIWNADLNLRTGQLSALATRTVGFAFKPDSFSTQVFFVLADGASTQLDMRLTGSGAIQVTRAGTALGTTTNLLVANAWVYIELQATIDPTVGAFTLKVWSGVNPGIWLAMTSQNTRATANSSTNGLTFQAVSPHYYIDDVYILNPSGSVNNNFLGECRIFTSLPTGDNTSATGTNKLWTPDAGTAHYTQVDDTPNPDDDTSYVSSATAGQIDTYTYPAIAPTGPIAAVQVTLTDRKDDAGARSICAEYRGGGANYDGASTFTPSTSYLMHRQIWEADPATGAAWTVAGVNAGEYGAKCVA